MTEREEPDDVRVLLDALGVETLAELRALVNEARSWREVGEELLKLTWLPGRLTA